MKHIYIFDLVKNLLKKKNIFAIIYLLLNIYIVVSIFKFLFDDANNAGLLAIFLYLFSVVVAVSPIGEFVLRLTQGCKRIEDPKVLSRLEPLFFEVVERAQTKHTAYPIDEGITLYIQDSMSPNAFAVGRRTVCVTTGLLAHSDEEIKAILGHELGHLATHDTDLVLLITVGNLIISAIVSIFKFIIGFYKIFLSIIASFLGGSDGLLVKLFSGVAGILTLVLVDAVMFLWTQFGVLMVMKTSRSAEYEADAFSCDLGFSEGLLSFFYSLSGFELKEPGGKLKLFAALASSHPSTKKRIARIEKNMGIVHQ